VTNQSSGSGPARPAGNARVLGVLLPVACFAAFTWVSVGFGLYGMEIPWRYFQLLDRAALTEAPGTALLLLHSQPPLLNSLLAGVLALSGWTGWGPEVWAGLVFVALGSAGAVLLFCTATDLFSSRWLALAIVLLTLFDPAALLFHRLFFYSYILQVLLLSLAFLSVRLAASGRLTLLLPTVAVLGATVNTSALFHPLWAVLTFVLLVAVTLVLHPGSAIPGARSVAGAGALLALLLLAWPLKNQLLFGHFTFSSWSSYNLARRTGEECLALSRYLQFGLVPRVARDDVAAFGERHPDLDLRVISSIAKTDGSRNWNHLVFLDSCGALGRRALGWRLAHPGRWLREAAANFLRWARPSYVDPYSDTLPAVGNAAFTAYCSWHRRLLHPDLRRLVGGTTAALPISPFTLLLPVVMVLSLPLLAHELRRRRPTGALLVVWLTVAWVLLVPCLTDGAEGNRMRFAVSPLVLLLGWYVVRRLYDAGSRAAPSGRASSPRR
jgi:hypothetical protein